uniref:Uncharacterized protein n=1 Tax=Babesia bovis TaxID=5865 RepID=S6C9D7_BABBO|nr:hypothetical protein [Babesia bovis]
MPLVLPRANSRLYGIDCTLSYIPLLLLQRPGVTIGFPDLRIASIGSIFATMATYLKYMA